METPNGLLIDFIKFQSSTYKLLIRDWLRSRLKGIKNGQSMYTGHKRCMPHYELPEMLYATKTRKYHVNVQCVGSSWAYSIIRTLHTCIKDPKGVANKRKYVKIMWI